MKINCSTVFILLFHCFCKVDGRTRSLPTPSFPYTEREKEKKSEDYEDKEEHVTRLKNYWRLPVNTRILVYRDNATCGLAGTLLPRKQQKEGGGAGGVKGCLL